VKEAGPWLSWEIREAGHESSGCLRRYDNDEKRKEKKITFKFQYILFPGNWSTQTTERSSKMFRFVFVCVYLANKLYPQKERWFSPIILLSITLFLDLFLFPLLLPFFCFFLFHNFTTTSTLLLASGITVFSLS
jgi:hypothetical protein